MKLLRAKFDAMKSMSLDPNEYVGDLGDVVFEITTADTFVAGIATTILDGGVVKDAHRGVVDAPLLDDSAWILPDGRLFDLSGSPEVLECARVIDDVRKECKRALGR